MSAQGREDSNHAERQNQSEHVLALGADEIEREIWSRQTPQFPLSAELPDGYVAEMWDTITATLSHPGGYASVDALRAGVERTLDSKRRRLDQDRAHRRAMETIGAGMAELATIHGDVDAFALIAGGSVSDQVKGMQEWTLVAEAPDLNVSRLLRSETSGQLTHEPEEVLTTPAYELRYKQQSGDYLTPGKYGSDVLRVRPGDSFRHPASRFGFRRLIDGALLTRLGWLIEVLEFRLALVEQVLMEYEIFGIALPYDARPERGSTTRETGESHSAEQLDADARTFISSVESAIRRVEDEAEQYGSSKTITTLKNAIVVTAEAQDETYSLGDVDRMFKLLEIYQPRKGQRGRPSEQESEQAYTEATRRVSELVEMTAASGASVDGES